ncbi:uncharacterized protein [Macrobrachium rosenbergii]|uniref:uncharacterized protein n=1 Tax=Macrobrachium rosenbergii TaxID=79674 RepID=UPI0034D6FE60
MNVNWSPIQAVDSDPASLTRDHLLDVDEEEEEEDEEEEEEEEELAIVPIRLSNDDDIVSPTEERWDAFTAMRLVLPSMRQTAGSHGYDTDKDLRVVFKPNGHQLASGILKWAADLTQGECGTSADHMVVVYAVVQLKQLTDQNNKFRKEGEKKARESACKTETASERRTSKECRRYTQGKREFRQGPVSGERLDAWGELDVMTVGGNDAQRLLPRVCGGRTQVEGGGGGGGGRRRGGEVDEEAQEEEEEAERKGKYLRTCEREGYRKDEEEKEEGRRSRRGEKEEEEAKKQGRRKKEKEIS